MKAVWAIITSRAISTWLLIAVTILLVIGSLLPNPEYMDPAAVADLQARNPLLLKIGVQFNSKKLVTGYFFGFIGIYLIISATLCSIERLVARRRERVNFLPDGAQSVVDVAIFVPSAEPEETRAFVVGWLRRRLFRVTVTRHEESGVISFSRGRFGFYGSIIFHTVLITVLFGLVLFYLGGTRGKLVFTEGQRYLLEKSRFTHLEKEPLWGLHLPQVELELVEHYSLYAHDVPQTAVEHLARFRVTRLEGGETMVRDVRVNSPLRLAGKDFLLITGGFSPRFVIARNGSEVVLFDSFVNLKGESGTKDDFFATDGLRVHIQFFPDLVQEGGKPATKSPLVRNPAAQIVVTQGGKQLADHVVPIGSSVQVAGYTISIPEIRRWVELEMVNESGIGFFFIISAIGIFGILVRMLDPDDQLVLVTRPDGEGTQLEFFVYSRHFSALLGGIARECAHATAAWADNAKGSKQ